MRASLFFILFTLPLIVCNVCPSGYTKAEEWQGGDCFKIKSYYDSFATQYIPKTFDEAEMDCNYDGGGLLTSIHSEKENYFIMTLTCDQMWKNIGLRCTGSDCKWDDGSPMTYQRFLGAGPKDDGQLRCYGIDATANANGSWQERSHAAGPCGKQKQDCWVCKAKAQSIYCYEGETEYNGGCVSVYSPPLDQRFTEPNCPDGSRLISIHSGTENNIYRNVAVNAGITGSIFIGGRFSNGIFHWNDTSIDNYHPWAYGFPNTIVGLCAQMLLDSESGSQGQWTNIHCSTNQPVFCLRDVGTPIIPDPKADAQCPSVQYYRNRGTMYSPNYPLSIPGQQSCEYDIYTEPDWKAAVEFVDYNCQSGSTLSLYDGYTNKLIITFTTDSPVLDQPYISPSFIMKIVFTTNDTTPVGTGFAVQYYGYHN